MLLPFTGVRVYPEDPDLAGKTATLLQLRFPYVPRRCKFTLSRCSTTNLHFRHHIGDELHYEMQCPWLTAQRRADDRRWDGEFATTPRSKKST